MTKHAVGWSLALCALVAIPSVADAAPPGLRFGGYLESSAGTPYGGSVDVETTLFDVELGGDALWGPVVFLNVPIDTGRFEVVLDASTPLGDAFAGLGSAYFAFRVRPEGQDWIALEGRQRAGSVGFAHQVADSERLRGIDGAEFLSSSELSGTYITLTALAPVATSGSYDDLASRPSLTGYALTNNLAGVCFSGSYDDLVDQPDLAVFVTSDALATVATSGDYGDISSRPDLSVYALTGDLALVATSGQYANLLGKPGLSALAPVSSLAAVAMTGSYFDLLGAPDPDALVWRDGSRAMTGDLNLGGHAVRNVAIHPSAAAPTSPVVGQGWFDTTSRTLEVYTDGGWKALEGTANLPSDGLSTVSNGTLSNVFTDGGVSGDVPLDIPDNYPPGVAASLTIDDSGTLRSLSIHIAITHPDATELKLVLTASGGQQYTLHDGGTGTSGGLDATWPPAPVVAGDLGALVGTSPTGMWTLSVADSVYSGGAPGDISGQLTDFSITYEVLRYDEVGVTGTLTVGGKDVAAELAALRAEVELLRARVAPCGLLRSPCATGFRCTTLGTCVNESASEAWIPAGVFWMGCNSAQDANCGSNEAPQNEVVLTSFAIDRFEVSAADYAACVSAGVCTQPGGGSAATYGVAGKEQHPVNQVTWDRAVSYCAWTGKPAGAQRLCSEAEWEKAARGGCETASGECAQTMRVHPWDRGDETPPTAPDCDLANFASGSIPASCEPDSFTSAVGSHPSGASPYGAEDMLGNVAEWVADWYSDSYPDTGPLTDPIGPTTGTLRVVRGGDFQTAPNALRSSSRFGWDPGSPAGDVGFRCCRTLP
ncbi:MAG: hypothetical protein EP329_25825 [Deltaproteobacteria bacterium]|nr:MAG: hypothetical protein EP329_25825 [Deltaproteobacteria bacterium]